MPSPDRRWSLPIKPLRRVKDVSAAATRRPKKHSRVWLYTQRVGVDVFIPVVRPREAVATSAGESRCSFDIEACSDPSLIMASSTLLSSSLLRSTKRQHDLYPTTLGIR